MKPKAANQIVTTKEFVEALAPALQEYLEYQFKKDGHILDLMASAAEFFSVSFHSVSASIELLGYTTSVTTSEKKK